MQKPRFVYVTYIRTTPTKLWKALTDAEVTRTYFYDTRMESDWKQGSSWRMLMPDGRVADAGEVLEVEPERRMVLTWHKEFIPELKAEGDTRLTYELEQVGDAVKLTITHESHLPESKMIQAVSNGWPLILASLKSLLETGESLHATRTWCHG